jgi:Tripartite tricarboxylate transporter TctB family
MRTTWQRAELLFCAFLVVVLAGALWISLGWSQRAGLFPWVVLVPTLTLAVWQLVDDARGKTAPPATVVGDEGETEELDAEAVAAAMGRRGGAVVAWILGFLGAIVLLGFAIGGGIGSALYLRFMARERWRVAIAYGIVTYLLLELLFRGLIGIPFPVGMLFEWLSLDPSLR